MVNSITRRVSGTLLGPLTTTWSIPDSCTLHVMNCATCTEAYQGQQCVMHSGTGRPEDHTNCWPPITSRAGTPTYPFLGWGYYSPGLACPTGYTTACTAVYGRQPDWEIEFPLIPGETAVGCCPQGYTCGNLDGNTCIAVASAGPQITVTTAMCSGTQMSAVAQAAFPDIITTTADSGVIETATRGVKLFAPMYQLNFQASDLESASSSVTRQQPSQTGTPTASTRAVSYTSTTSSTSSASSDPSSAASTQGGLSTSATIGLGVGAALGIVLLVALIVGVWLCLRKRARGAAAEAGQASDAFSRHTEPQSQQQWASAELPVPNAFFKHTEPQPQQQWASAELPVYAKTWTGPPPVEMSATSNEDHWHPGEGRQTQQSPTLPYH